MSILQVSNLSKRYGKVQALRNAGFEVEGGEIFGYLGPNGAGKTTTLRIILGLVRPNSGEVSLFGNKTMRADLHNALGFLPGELQLYGDMTSLGVLDYFAHYRPQRPPALREKLLEAFAVEPAVLSRKVKFLSHGTKQKIGLIIAMQHDPDLLLLDEPTTGLDPLVQQAFRDLVLDFAQRGKAVFFSSHVLSEVEAVCGRVAILRAGEIVTVESIENLRGKMVRRLQARFRGAAPEELSKTPGVARSQISGRDAELWVQGDLNPIIRRLAQADLEQLVFPEPELEDIFLSYYQSNSGEPEVNKFSKNKFTNG
jgi:ABC-2 type transport system ATP-binding protein